MRACLLGVVLALMCATPAAAAPELVKIGDFTDPVHVASPPNDPRVFVVEQGGLVKIVGGGTFIDLTGPTLPGFERGLLSIAFPPDYAASGRFYVFLTSRPNGDVEVREYRRSAANPNLADPAPVRTLLDEPHSAQYHNGGQLQFGPDGALYVSIGDNTNGANAQSPSSPFGKILRLDPAGGARQVWSSGLRNPWRFSFDPPTGDMIVGDVGENAWEEINWVLGPGLNFGWPGCEGPDPTHACGEHPVVAMDHSGADAFRAIVGGYVVRDPGLPTLNGRYLYGDNEHSTLWSAVPRTGAGNRAEPLTVAGLSSFGQDSCGRLYVASRGGDAVYRIQDGAPTPCSFPAPGPVPGAADAVRPGLRVTILRPALKRRRLRLAVRCDEPCRVAVTSRLRTIRKLKVRRRALAANTRAVMSVPMSRATARRVRLALRRRGFVRIQVTVRATDAAGNRAIVTRRGRIRR